MKWLSEYEKCDICNNQIKNKVKWFVDGKTKNGPWALMCPSCFKKFGFGLGVGRGQKYDGKTAQLMEREDA